MTGEKEEGKGGGRRRREKEEGVETIVVEREYKEIAGGCGGLC